MTVSVHTPIFNQLEVSLQGANASMSPAESHGLLCGMLCSAGRLNTGQWLNEIFEDAGIEGRGVDTCRSELLNLAEATVNQLNNPALEFALLLPEEDESLERRAEALVDWSRNYLYGLALGGLADPDDLPGDVAEIISDLSEISRADAAGDDDTDEAQNALEEIIEYVRMGVLLVNEELQPIKAPPTLQ